MVTCSILAFSLFHISYTLVRLCGSCREYYIPAKGVCTSTVLVVLFGFLYDFLHFPFVAKVWKSCWHIELETICRGRESCKMDNSLQPEHVSTLIHMMHS
ncbi:uncharacterized protein BO95DRAFT_123636 [Aspergillus brunneoviolaceus CBS 621.78]|uniref:Uncharacterized protein n=1 Tax=Aspergillus brunneoviolaceus CBS 621.78 TaxID=1450534 RepID=A0ACD1GA10_9EURO|nr:hypothetical protein BO95DRAFT_123636 [Aspergillus brunneoviolaceus CBS 621.78]RAH46089.1 hypothetical protein BO95DRAFT_123636 [Aspergillus brunneoviolaceus CBS 621.78]